MSKPKKAIAPKPAKTDKIYDMRTDDMVDPIGIDNPAPVFSWKMSSSRTGWAQKAYRITVKNGNTALWDSGKVKSAESVGIKYEGGALSSSTLYGWKVTVWDENGVETVSETAAFETGLLEDSDKSDVKWISCPSAVSGKGGLPVYRKSFTPAGGLVSAKLYTSGLGVYESYINGQRVGRLHDDGSIEYHELKPGFTEASKRKFYNAYDVTHMLNKNGENVLSAVVTSGWWSGLVAANYGKETAYWAKLILKYGDGTVKEIVTDTTWKTAALSAVVYADIFNGETYDARINEDWKIPGYNDSDWSSAKINNEFEGKICAWKGSFITVREDLELSVKNVQISDGIAAGTSDGSHFGKVNVIRTASDGKFSLGPGETALIDFGQNFAGREAFEAEGEEGTVISVRHGEILNDGNGAKNRGCDGPEGSIYNANYRSAKAMTKYIMSGKGTEKYHPSFTFYGFRYIEITVDKPVTFKSVTGQVVTSVEKDTGFISTSDRDVNKLISNIRWGQYSNYLSVPTDCPQRDERQGWTADTQVFSETGCYLGFSKSFLKKFMTDIGDSQRDDGALPGTAPTGEYKGGDWGGTGWADAGIIIPFNLYMMYGDKTVIQDNWGVMTSYMNYLSETDKKGPAPIWGDWLAYESNDDKVREILGVTFYAWDALLMSKMAEATGRKDEAEKYSDVYRQEKEFFISRYVNPDGTLVRGEQTICLYALYLDLLPDEVSAKAVKEQLVSNIEKNGNKLQTGFLGTAIIMDTLTKIGRSDVAYSLLLQHDNPSWLYSVDQGATTVWERWNSYTVRDGLGSVSMNSFNHYAYGAVASWMFGSMAGIDYDSGAPGFRRIIIAPRPDARIAEVTASYDSAYGTVSAKSKIDGDKWTYSLTLPANTSAEIRLPVKEVKVNGKSADELSLEKDGICLIKKKDGVYILKAVSGTFELTSLID